MAVNVEEHIPRGPAERPFWTVSDLEKTLVTYTVKKSIDGFSLFGVFPSNGPVPKELDQKFTRAKTAVETVSKYLHSMKATQAVKNVETHKRIKAKQEEKT